MADEQQLPVDKEPGDQLNPPPGPVSQEPVSETPTPNQGNSEPVEGPVEPSEGSLEETSVAPSEPSTSLVAPLIQKAEDFKGEVANTIDKVGSDIAKTELNNAVGTLDSLLNTLKNALQADQ